MCSRRCIFKNDYNHPELKPGSILIEVQIWAELRVLCSSQEHFIALMVNIFFAFAISATLVSAAPSPRQTEARVVSSCTKPMTAALTFVCIFYFQVSQLPFTIIIPGRRALCILVSSCPRQCQLRAITSHPRYDVSKTLKASNATGTFFFSKFSFYHKRIKTHIILKTATIVSLEALLNVMAY